MISVLADAFKDLEQYFDGLPGVTTTAARLALNDTARGPAMKLARMQMNSEINFPTGYLNKDRLYVDKLATNADLEAVITGRDRATSLARFATSGSVGSRGGVTVSVSKGSSTSLKKAFLVKLRQGKTMDGSTFNVGLAIRLGPGETIQNRTSTHMTMLGNNVALLYGPSVDQVFKAVASDIAPNVADEVATEFFRQFTRLSNG
jgi:hypothetical protein